MLKNIIARYARNSLITTTKLAMVMKVAGTILVEMAEVQLASIETTNSLLEQEEIDHRLYDNIQKTKEIISAGNEVISFVVNELRPIMITSVINTRRTLEANDVIRDAHLRWFTEGSLDILRVMPAWIEEGVRQQMDEVIIKREESKIVDATEAGRVVAAVENSLRAAGFTVPTVPKD
jgi:hypothetical protein